ncbi:MAG: PEP-CTERM sorting domain-containing protein [Akkermansia sp.]
MKSTLFTIVLMAVSSMAMADITYISNAGNSESVINTPTDITWAEVGALSRTITINSGSDTLGSTDYTNSAAFAATNVGSGGSWTYTLTFDIASIAEGKSITQIGIDFLSASSSGSVQNQGRDFNAAITLSTGGTDVINKKYAIETKAAGSSNSVDSAYSNGITLNESASSAHLSITDLDLDAGSYTLSITFSQKTDAGTFAGVGNIALHTDVPESSTAVLSLLAVVGLVARRRRRA